MKLNFTENRKTQTHNWVQSFHPFKNSDGYTFRQPYTILIILILNIVFKNNSSVLQSVSKMNSFKMCINSIAGPTFIIGISIVYFGLKNPEYCGDNLSTLNLVFLIIEYSLIGLVFLILFCVCCCACCCAAFSSGTKE